MKIAIDGPAGAGKSSVAKAVARELGLRYLDTGAMYRAVALAALESGIDPDDERLVGELTTGLDLEVTRAGVTLGGAEVEARIRRADVTRAAAQVARHPAVREALVALQRRAAAAGDVVMEGRDIGSAVLPDADLKIFLTAALDERARRRSRQAGDEATPERLEELTRAIEERDAADRSRAASPLIQASDAVVIDTTALTEPAVVELIADLARRLGR